MYDTFNRKIDYLRISVTDRCNLRCIYCMPRSGLSILNHSDILRYEEITEIVAISLKLGINKFRITGGEPLVRKGFVEFIAKLKIIEGIKDLSITTNGIKLREYAKPLHRAGLARINISLDTLNEDKFKRMARGGDLKDVLDGIDSALKAGFYPIKINVVLISGINDDEILDFAKLAFDKPLDVRFIELMPIGEAALSGFGNISENDVKKICNSLGELRPEENIYHGNGPAKYYKIRGFLGRIGFISAVTNTFCGKCNRLRLTSNGYLKPCLGYDQGVDLKPALRPEINNSKIAELMENAINSKPKGHNMRFVVKDGGFKPSHFSKQPQELENNLCVMSRIGG